MFGIVHIEDYILAVDADDAVGGAYAVSSGVAYSIYGQTDRDVLICTPLRRHSRTAPYRRAVLHLQNGYVVAERSAYYAGGYGVGIVDIAAAVLRIYGIFAAVQIDIDIRAEFIAFGRGVIEHDVGVGDYVHIARLPVDIDYDARACRNCLVALFEEGKKGIGARGYFKRGGYLHRREQRAVYCRLHGGHLPELGTVIAEILRNKFGERQIGVARFSLGRLPYFIYRYILTVAPVLAERDGTARKSRGARKRQRHCRRG